MKREELTEVEKENIHITAANAVAVGNIGSLIDYIEQLITARVAEARKEGYTKAHKEHLRLQKAVSGKLEKQKLAELREETKVNDGKDDTV